MDVLNISDLKRYRKEDVQTNVATYVSDWKPPLVKGLLKYIVGALIRFHILFLALKICVNPIKAFQLLQKLDDLRKSYLGEYFPKKLFFINGRYYWDMHAPGWPSKAFVNFNKGEMNRIVSFDERINYYNSLIFAITKKCPLNCEHCYEGDVINHPEKLSRDDLKTIVRKFQSQGTRVAQIQLSGGEPLVRIDDIVSLLQDSDLDSDFWLVTSGYTLTLEKAQRLKQSGLIGVCIAIDHFNEDEHNSFRGVKDSFKRAAKAVEYAHHANLVVVLSLCVTRAFTNVDNLMNYAQMAKSLGVFYILLIEPKAVGRYKNKDVSLSKKQEGILEEFYLKMNNSDTYYDYPGVSYHGYHQRRAGCFGGTKRFVYINTDGEVQICPFCQVKNGNVLSPSFNINNLAFKSSSCQPYQQIKSSR